MLNNKKIRLGILFGGQSAEHEISIQSAKNVFDAVDREKIDPVLIGINKTGQWYYFNDRALLEKKQQLVGDTTDSPVAVLPGIWPANLQVQKESIGMIDVFFPVLHGPRGEDGTIQGLFTLLSKPFVGPGVLGSAMGMDKDIMKRIMRDAGIPISDYIVFKKHDREECSYQECTEKLGLPLFIKPANMGSSVGVHKVTCEDEFNAALDDAFQFDNKIIVEEFIDGQEVECAILGNKTPQASIVGTIAPSGNHEFYSYESKYLDENGYILQIPANLSDEVIRRVQDISIQVFKALECSGCSRVDSFVASDGSIVVNEINTIPGFTNISMYPKLWEASGVSYTDLITKLVEFAIEKFEEQSNLKTSYATSD